MTMDLSWWYLPMALMLGALHALEPGHAKTIAAAYLINIKGTAFDALLLGLAVAITHSALVIGLAVTALYLSNELFTKDIMSTLEWLCALTVIAIGALMLYRRLRSAKACAHDHDHDHHHDEVPDYAKRGERPSIGQIIAFGAVGGMIPCPAALSVMLLAVNAGKTGLGLMTVAGFSIGMGCALIAVGLLVVAGFKKIANNARFEKFARHLPAVSAFVVILSGVFALAKHSIQ
jgi:nickel/cobalt exporter